MESLRTCLHDNRAVTSCVAGAGSLMVAYLAYRRIARKPAPAVSAPPGTVILHQIPRGSSAPSLSPFPLKLETFLRLNKVPYVNDFSRPMSAKGKTPWISLDGEDVADSQLAIRHLSNKLNLDPNINLTSQQKAVARAIQVMVDEHLYWTMVYCRWIHDPHKTVLTQHFPRGVMTRLMLWHFSRLVRSQLHGQGMGRHSAQDIKHFMVEDLNTLNNHLGDKKFMMGDEIAEVDCSVFGMLCQFVYHSEDDIMKDLVQNVFPKLVLYTERIKASLWPDWDSCLDQGQRITWSTFL